MARFSFDFLGGARVGGFHLTDSEGSEDSWSNGITWLHNRLGMLLISRRTGLNLIPFSFSRPITMNILSLYKDMMSVDGLKKQTSKSEDPNRF